jgi:hypothetical protein
MKQIGNGMHVNSIGAVSLASVLLLQELGDKSLSPIGAASRGSSSSEPDRPSKLRRLCPSGTMSILKPFIRSVVESVENDI